VTNENMQEKELKENPIAIIEMENGSMIKIELYPALAPQTVKNFISLVSQGFYNGLIFHRVIPGFMIQGGDPTGTGMGGSKQTIPGEFSSNGFKNDLKHDVGVISMARTSAPNSASSQFFIVDEAAYFLDGEYAAFGKVIEGMTEVHRIANVPRDRQDKPLEDQRMKKVFMEF
jgi:peptidyl-prolyl cis-trans isomerase B (cyclophilin B)